MVVCSLCWHSGCASYLVSAGTGQSPLPLCLDTKVQDRNISCLKCIYSCEETYLFINLLALHPIFNGSEELALVAKYSHVSPFTAVKSKSGSELMDLTEVEIPWSVSTTHKGEDFFECILCPVGISSRLGTGIDICAVSQIQWQNWICIGGKEVSDA